MKTIVYLKKSTRKGKKYMVWVNGKTVHFGSAGMSDYTKHKDKERKNRYISRHKTNENWKKSGIKTAGFWSKWLLWNKPSIGSSKSDIRKRFNVSFRSGWPSNKQKKELRAKSRKTKSRKRK